MLVENKLFPFPQWWRFIFEVLKPCPHSTGAEGEIKVVPTPSSVSSQALCFASARKCHFSHFPWNSDITNTICSVWYSVMLWAVLQNRWQVLSVFKYCKKKISYNGYKAELFVAFFFILMLKSLCMFVWSVFSTVFIKTYGFCFCFFFFLLQIKK